MIGTFFGVGVSIYYGYRAMNDPGVTVDGVDELLVSSQQQTQVAGEIRDAITPLDEVEILAGRGYAIDLQGFQRALRSGDQTSIALFCRAPISPLTKSYWAIEPFEMTDKLSSLLRDCSAVDIDALCELDDSRTYPGGRPSFPFKQDIVSKLCSASVYREKQQIYENRLATFEADLADDCRAKMAMMAEKMRKWGEGSAVETDFIMFQSDYSFSCESVGVLLTRQELMKY